MAIHFSDDVVIPQSTGAVTTPAGETVIQQTPGHPVSTDAVPGPPDTVTTTFGPLGQESTGTVATPGPVTYDTPAFNVIDPAARQDGPSADAAVASATEESPASAESRRSARAAERSTQPDDYTGR